MNEHKINLKKPTNCHLWSNVNIKEEDLNCFEELITFEEDNHIIRRLLKCKDCGQLYFYEFYKEIDWVNGNDPQYRTYIPVEKVEDAEELAKLSQLGLLSYFPRLQNDWPSDTKEKNIHWVR